VRRRQPDERPPIEVVGVEPGLTSLQHVSTGGPGGPRRHGTRGLVLGAVVVGMLLIGLALGDDDDDDSPTASQALAEDAEDTTSTTRRRTTTTSTRPRATTTEATLQVGPVFAGQQVSGWLLSGNQSGWTLVDIETGAQSDPDLPFDNPYATRTVEGGVIVVRSSRQAEYHDLRVPTEDREAIELGPADQVLPSGTPDQVWLIDSGGRFEEAAEGETRASLVDLSGRELRSFAVPSGYVAGASSQGLLFERGGRVYLADEGGVRPVAIGQVVGAVGDLMLLFTCDDDARCGAELREVSGRGGRRLAIEGSLNGGFEIASHVDGRFAVTAYGSDGGIATTLFEADGTQIGPLGRDPTLSGPLSWLPGDAGLVGTRNGRVVWLNPTGGDWVLQEPPALAGLQADGVVAIGR
jgi:hypothetical protein